MAKSLFNYSAYLACNNVCGVLGLTSQILELEVLPDWVHYP